MTSRNGDVARLRTDLEREGWAVTQSRHACHFHVRDPRNNNALVTVFSSSPSTGNARHRIRRQIERYLAARGEQS